MRILLVTTDLVAGNLGIVFQDEGHEVRMYVDDAGRRGNFIGIVPLVDDWQEQLPWVGTDGLIVFDDTGWGEHVDTLRASGYTVWGSGVRHEMLEQDRSFAQHVFASVGMQTSPLYTFSSCAEAREFVLQNPKAWVIKQNGHAAKILNYVGQDEDGMDVAEMLGHYQEKYGNTLGPISIQERVFGIEIACARYFNGTDWVGPIELNIEHKRLFPGDIGPTTGEMGTLAWHTKNEDTKLFRDTLARLTPYLAAQDYRGIIDINCIVNESGTYPLEATTRFGSPIIHLQCAMLETSQAELYAAIARGEKPEVTVMPGYGLVALIAIPPFPYVDSDVGLSAVGTTLSFDRMNDEDMRNIWFEEVAYDTGRDRFYISDMRGYVLYVTAVCETAQETQDLLYERIKKLTIPRMMYRNDLGSAFIERDRQRLSDWGYLD